MIFTLFYLKVFKYWSKIVIFNIDFDGQNRSLLYIEHTNYNIIKFQFLWLQNNYISIKL